MVLLFISSVEMLAQNRWKKQGRARRARLPRPAQVPWVASGPRGGAGGVRRGSPRPRGCFSHGETPWGCFLHLCHPSPAPCQRCPTRGGRGQGTAGGTGTKITAPRGRVWAVGAGRSAVPVFLLDALGAKRPGRMLGGAAGIAVPCPVLPPKQRGWPSCCLGVPGLCRGARARVPSVGWCHRSLGSAECGARAPFCNWCRGRDGILRAFGGLGLLDNFPRVCWTLL